jgi:hypothetical protein
MSSQGESHRNLLSKDNDKSVFNEESKEAFAFTEPVHGEHLRDLCNKIIDTLASTENLPATTELYAVQTKGESTTLTDSQTWEWIPLAR